MTLETRTNNQTLETRDDDGKSVVVGLGVSYGGTAEIGDSFREVFAPGAFARSINEDVLALFGHDRNRVLGRTTAGTLRLREDARGVHYEIDLPDTTDGRDLAVSVARGDIRGTSFGFRAVRETWDDTANPPVRTIHEAVLREISPTADPAYEDTTIAMRSLDAARKERRSSNYNHAARRLRMKISLDLKGRE
ncbi:HK97 family phage prohead protease [Brevundimonas faecalis]|uniref:HK97 family phage prohead protease n=1 Tax=Brevundimonas faecalis TaxID=947378 RepID=UPI003606E8D1